MPTGRPTGFVGRLLGVVVILSASALAATAGPARACTCAVADPREAIARSDGAFIGTFVERRAPADPRSSADPAIYVFRVRETVKGSFGATVEVISALSGASCGLEVRVGETIGLFLDRRNGRWHSSLCQQVAPARLRAASRPLPAPNGSGPAALLVGGRFGSARSLALDARGRTLGYGWGPGPVAAFGVCPGMRRVVELIPGRRAQLLVRTLPRMRLVARRALGTAAGGFFEPAVSCRSRDASQVVVFARPPFRRGAGSRVVLLRRTATRTLWRGTALFARIGARHAYLAAGRRGERLVRLDLVTGRATRLARVGSGVGGLFLRPDERAVALVARARVTVLPLGRGTRRVRALPCCGARVVWLTKQRLAVVGNGLAPQILDARLRPVAAVRAWLGSIAVARAGRLFGVAGGGRLVSVPQAGAPVRVLRFLPGTTTTAMAALAPPG